MSARCSARVSSSTERRETTMLPRRRSILRIWNGCGWCISGPMSRTGRMSTWLPGRNATAPSRSTVKPPLTLLKMTPATFSLCLELLLEPGPALLAPRLVARQHGLAERVLDALQIDLDLVADLELGRLAGDARTRAAARGLPS